VVYEFECKQGHITEAMVPMGTREWPCAACEEEMRQQKSLLSVPLAHRILSPTRTTFRFADRRGAA